MSLNQAMSGGKRKARISVKDIRANILNFYDLENIEELAASIEVDGQLENGVVYAKTGEDGKKYTLISGHRRFSAISLLLEQGRGDGFIDVVVHPSPEVEIKEEMLVIKANGQRTKTPQEREKEIAVAKRYWDFEKSEGRISEGTVMRDWIGEQIGLKGRQVQDYLSGRIATLQTENVGTSAPASRTDGSTAISETREPTMADFRKLCKKVVKMLWQVQTMAENLPEEDLDNETVQDITSLAEEAERLL